jgi:hypothetical protein
MTRIVEDPMIEKKELIMGTTVNAIRTALESIMQIEEGF